MTFLLPPGIKGLTIFVNFLDFLPFICYKNTNHVKLTPPPPPPEKNAGEEGGGQIDPPRKNYLQKAQSY